VPPIKTKTTQNKTICIPYTTEKYEQTIDNPTEFRSYLDNIINLYRELFPVAITEGYQLKDSRYSKKLGLRIRRIETRDGQSWSVRPSFVTPYLSGYVSEVEKPLFLRKFNVPFWGLAYVFGKDAMYWYRLECALGRNSLVGTTVKSAEALPKDLLADEKHTKQGGQKVYIAVTAGQDCILGAEIAASADTQALTEAYGVFKSEALQLDPDYQPESVNLDGWLATKQAWLTLFPHITIILCFLHAFLSIRNRAKKKGADTFRLISQKVWDTYHAPDKRSFSQRIRRLREWATAHLPPSPVKEKLLNLCHKKEMFITAYDHPSAHRTSNMVDRLIKFMDRWLFASQYFHGTTDAARLQTRGWALLVNFCPSTPLTIKKYHGKISPAERLNGFRYHGNWLQNLLISASIGGTQHNPQKTL
jgi:hypothetical protein